MKLRFLGGRFQGRIVNIPGGSFTIGRGQRNDLSLDQDGVSRYHCKLTCENGRWYIEDLESTNGVRLNGNRIEGKQPIRPGDRVGISGNLLLFSEESADDADPSLRSSLKSLEFSRHAVALDSDAKTQPEYGLGTVSDGMYEDEEEDGGWPWVRLGILAVVLLVFLGLGIDHIRRTVRADSEGGEEVVGVDEKGDAGDENLWVEPKDGLGAPPPPDGPPDGAGEEAPVPPPENDNEAPEDATTDGAPDGGQRTEHPPANWYAVVRSEPSGATAFIDDEPAGTTPLAVELAPGRHRLRLAMAGYEDLQRLIDDGVLYPRKPFVLLQEAGTLMVQSEPTGASVLHGRQLLGTTPLLVRTLPPGEHPLTVQKYGYETAEVMGTVSEVQGIEKAVELAARLGTLEVVTFPPGCTVRVDGVRKGVTKGPDGPHESEPLVVPGLLDEMHALKVTHPIAGDRSGTVRVPSGQVVRRTVRFWMPTHVLVLRDGGEIYGMQIPDVEDGEVAVLDHTFQVRRFTADAVEGVRKLPPDDVRILLEDGLIPSGLGPADEDRGKDGADDLPEPDFRLSAVQFQVEIKQTALGDLRDQFIGKTVRARGIPRKIIAARRVAHVWLGDSIHCQLDAAMLPTIRAAKEADRALSLQGTVNHCSAEEIVVTHCMIVPGVP